MKNAYYLTIIFVLAFANFASGQTTKHLWQVPQYRTPYVLINQKGQLAVVTYDRLSIYNVETGALEKTYNLLANRSPFVWPGLYMDSYSENFDYFHFYGQAADSKTRFNVKFKFQTSDEKWTTTAAYEAMKINFLGIDIQGRDLVADRRKDETRVYQPNGEKSKKIANIGHVYLRPGGRFGISKDNAKISLIDFTTDMTKELPFIGELLVSDQVPDWLIIKNGSEQILYNPYTEETEVKALNDVTRNVPTKYVEGIKKIKNAMFYGNYIYKVVIDSTQSPDRYGAVPFLINQYSVTDLSLIRTFAISASKNENDALAATLAPIYDIVKIFNAQDEVAAAAKKAERDAELNEMAERREAERLGKELLTNFKESGTMDSFSLLGLKGRDITDLPYTKKYLSHIKGEITAIFQFPCGASRILVVAAKVGNDVTFMFVRTSNTGVYKFTKNIANVYNRGNLISENIAIGFTNIGGTIKADVTFMYPATGNKRTTVVYAPCSGDWK